MDKGGDSSSEGHEFESLRRILDGHFFALVSGKICIGCLKRLKMSGKEAENSPFKQLFSQSVRLLLNTLEKYSKGIQFCYTIFAAIKV